MLLFLADPRAEKERRRGGYATGMKARVRALALWTTYATLPFLLQFHNYDRRAHAVPVASDNPNHEADPALAFFHALTGVFAESRIRYPICSPVSSKTETAVFETGLSSSRLSTRRSRGLRLRMVCRKLPSRF